MADFTIPTNDAYKVNSLIIGPEVDPIAGKVKWDPMRSLWNGLMLLGAIILAPIFFTWGAFLLFLFYSN